MRANMYNYEYKLDEQDFEELCEENDYYIRELEDMSEAKDKLLASKEFCLEILHDALYKACYNCVLEKLNYKVSKKQCDKLAKEMQRNLITEMVDRKNRRKKII